MSPPEPRLSDTVTSILYSCHTCRYPVPQLCNTCTTPTTTSATPAQHAQDTSAKCIPHLCQTCIQPRPHLQYRTPVPHLYQVCATRMPDVYHICRASVPHWHHTNITPFATPLSHLCFNCATAIYHQSNNCTIPATHLRLLYKLFLGHQCLTSPTPEFILQHVGWG